MLLSLPDFSLLEINAENPSAISTVYALIMSLVLSALIAFTYDKTSSHNKAAGHFIQSMILGSIIAAIVTIAIGDSIGRGLGMLGIMAMIRFRTNIAQPRNIIFLFSALGVGIACGVFAFNVALYGAIFFCLIAFVLNYSPFQHYYKKEQVLRIIFPGESTPTEKELSSFFTKLYVSAKLIRTEIKTNNLNFETEMYWELTGLTNEQTSMLIPSIKQFFEPINIRLTVKYDEQLI